MTSESKNFVEEFGIEKHKDHPFSVPYELTQDKVVQSSHYGAKIVAKPVQSLAAFDQKISYIKQCTSFFVSDVMVTNGRDGCTQIRVNDYQ